MAKRSVDEWDSERVEVVLVTKQDVPTTVRLRLLKPVKLNIIGKSTGETYHFPGGGSELDIDYNDAQMFLEKRYGGCDCPSDTGSKPYFEIVD
jgi:hypothetical protein